MLKKINEIHLEVTDKCNLDCSYCYFVEKNKLKSNNNTEFLNAIKLVYSATNENEIKVVFHGAEPLINSSVWFDKICSQIIDTSNEIKKTTSFQIQTNGTLLKDSHIHVFKKYDFKVNVSLDGNKAIHNSARGMYENTIQSIIKLQNNDLLDSVIAVISKHNYNKTKEIISHFLSLKIKRYHFNLASITNGNNLLVLSKENIFEFYKTEFDVFKMHYKEIFDWRLINKLARFIGYNKHIENTINLTCDAPICHAGVHMILVRPNGDFYPCGSCVSNSDSINRFKLGNIGQPIVVKDYENKLLHFHEIYFQNSKKCQTCDASIICEFYCPAFDVYDSITAKNRCIATRLFHNYLMQQDKMKIEEIVSFYKNDIYG